MQDNVFGKRLKYLRQEQGVSQKELGARLGYCNQTVSFWESGQREPDLDAIKKIAVYFDVTADFLLGLSD